jgi:hypothetical protein
LSIPAFALFRIMFAMPRLCASRGPACAYAATSADHAGASASNVEE